MHSVIEAAVAGAPIVTGPAIANSAEATELKSMGLLQVVDQPQWQAFGALVEKLCKTRPGFSKKIRA